MPAFLPPFSAPHLPALARLWHSDGVAGVPVARLECRRCGLFVRNVEDAIGVTAHSRGCECPPWGCGGHSHPKHSLVNSRISGDHCILKHVVTPEWCPSRPMSPNVYGRDTHGSCLEDTPNAGCWDRIRDPLTVCDGRPSWTHGWLHPPGGGMAVSAANQCSQPRHAMLGR